MRLNVEQQSRNHYSQKELNSLTPPWIDLPLNDLTFPRTITVTLYYESLRPLRRAKSRVLIPEYKWHFQEHASDRPSRTNRRRLTGSICNILSRDGRKGREREREREAFRSAKVFALGAAIALFVSLPQPLAILWQREEVSARNGPTFWLGPI